MLQGSADPPARRPSRAATTRRRLLEAATAELVERGGRLEVDPVAARAEVSVGSIYRHFGSRAGLVGAVVDDFYMRYRAEVEIDPVPNGPFSERERRRTELAVKFHYEDPLAYVILSSLHLDPEVAVREAAHLDVMIAHAGRVMALGQNRGELPTDRDPRFIAAMIVGGMRRVLAMALASVPPIAQRPTAHELWVLNAALMGLEIDHGH